MRWEGKGGGNVRCDSDFRAPLARTMETLCHLTQGQNNLSMLNRGVRKGGGGMVEDSLTRVKDRKRLKNEKS